MNSERAPLLGGASPSEFSEEEAHRREEGYGYLLVVLSAFAFLFMSSIVHYVTAFRMMKPASILILRGSTQALLALIFTYKGVGIRQVFDVPYKYAPLLVFRALIGGVNIGMAYISFALIPLGVLISILFLYPQVTLILSTCLLNETVSMLEVLCCLVTFFGVIMISDPSLSFPNELPRDYIIGVLLILFCTPLKSGETICIRFLGKKVHFLFHVLILGMAIAGVGLIMGGFTLPELWTDKTSVVLGFVAGMFGFVGQAMVNKGFQHCRAGTGTILRSIDVPLSYFAGLIFFNERPEVLCLLGSAIVVGSTTIVGLQSFKKKALKVVKTSEK